MNYDREFSIALLEVKTLGTPRAQITLDRMMFLVASLASSSGLPWWLNTISLVEPMTIGLTVLPARSVSAMVLSQFLSNRRLGR